jgi:hypothetical protein
MKLRRTLLNSLHALLWLLPLIAVFSGKLTTPVLIVLALWLCVKGWPILRMRNFWEEFARSCFALIIALLLAWPLLTAWHSLTPERSFFSTLNVAMMLVLGAIAVRLTQRLPSPFPLKPTVSSLLAAILIPVALILQEWALNWQGLIHGFFVMTGSDGAVEITKRYSEFMEKSFNRSLCVLVLTVWPAIYGLLIIERRIWAYALPLLALPAVMLMQSGAALLALLAGMLIFHIVRLMPRLMPPLLSCALIVFLIVWPLLFPHLHDSIAPGTEHYDDLPRSAQHRLAIWDFTLDHVVEKPLLGWGFDTSRAIPGGLEEFAPGQQWLPLHPHNSVLQLLLEEGMIGFGLSLGALGLVLSSWIAQCRTQPVFGAVSGAALYGFLIIGFITFGLWQTWWLACAWLLMLFLTGFRHFDSRQGLT